MWLRVACLTVSLCCCSASVFLGRHQANGLLTRVKRANSGWFEELKKGDLERECLEEKCSYEEAREVYEHTETTDEFWKLYNVQDGCESNPCQNNGNCTDQSGTMYTCLCPSGFRGRHCDLELKAVPDSCLHANGGCDHFCEEGGGKRTCSCAEGYFLGDDGQDCVSQETISCGMIPVLQSNSSDKASLREDPRARIVGGTECPKGQCPWQVQYDTGTTANETGQVIFIHKLETPEVLLVTNGKGFCGGIFYKPTWIITASHCLVNIMARSLSVVAGEHDIEKDEGTEQQVQVVEIIMHAGYVHKTADNDIGLLRLEKPIDITRYAVPVCLPTRSMAERELWAVSLHTVSGWGRRSEFGPTSQVLRRLKVPRIRTQDCVENSGVKLTENMFCAGYIEGKQDSCKGDSGGPLVTLYRRTVFLLGIVSWGKGCAQPGNYGIYTRVSNYLEWIHNVTATVQPQNITVAT